MKNIRSTAKSLYFSVKRKAASLGYYSQPSFIIIGAQKAGTSALFSILSQHPEIASPSLKEIHFFDGASIRYGDFAAYHSMFPFPFQMRPNKVTFEASPSYLVHPECPQRLKEYDPNLRLITILRDPVARAYSSWNMYRRFENSPAPQYRKLSETRSFEDAVMEEITQIDRTGHAGNLRAYVERGIYVTQLERYFNLFPRHSCLILDYEAFVQCPKESLQTVCEFVRLENTSFDFKVKKKNVSVYSNAIPPEMQAMLRSYYAPHNEKLFALLGQRFDW
jgi:hypothetical protein